MYQVVIEKQAQKQGRPGYRIRVGDYRIIYQIKDNILTVFILIIVHRREVYDLKGALLSSWSPNIEN